METILMVGLAGAAVLFIVVMFAVHKSGIAGSQPIYIGNMPVAKATEPRWQVRFAGDWFACSPPIGDNSPGWVQVHLADKRTHGRPIIRPAGEVRKLE